jgi:hypothetical protein
MAGRNYFSLMLFTACGKVATGGGPMTQRKKLPIGIQSFSKLREGGYYYVDKTPYAWQLSQQSGYFFISRPRRFGKSLFLDTLKELFEGNEALFSGSVHS